jgi:ABC-2 type transport system permease protein
MNNNMKHSTLRDALLIGKNELLIQVRNPLWLFFGLFQPIVYLTLFSPFLKGIASTPGFPASNPIQFFAPGLLIMNVLFGAAFAGFGLIDQLRSGFIERIRVTPISRLAIVLGLVFRSPIVLITQSTILLVIAVLFFGLKVSMSGVLLIILLLIIIGITMASLSFTIALIVKDEGTLAAVTNFFTLPLFLLAGVMLPITFAPKVIQNIAKWNPFAYAVDAARALINGVFDDKAIWIALGSFVVLGFLTLSWFIKTMREAVA